MKYAHLYIIRGLPGAGKSTLAMRMIGDHMIYFEADMWMVDEKGKYKFDPARLEYAHSMCQKAVLYNLQKDKEVIVSNTFTRIREMQPYIDMGFPFTVITVEGNHGSIHNVPAEKIEEMRVRWEPYRP